MEESVHPSAATVTTTNSNNPNRENNNKQRIRKPRNPNPNPVPSTSTPSLTVNQPLSATSGLVEGSVSSNGFRGGRGGGNNRSGASRGNRGRNGGGGRGGGLVTGVNGHSTLAMEGSGLSNGSNAVNGGSNQIIRNDENVSSSSSSIASDQPSTSSGANHSHPHPHLHPHQHAHPHQHPHQNGNNNQNRLPNPNPRSKNNNNNNNNSSRRSRFNSALTTSSPLTASSTPFNPNSNSSNSNQNHAIPSPSPVTETLISRLTTELTNGTYDCSICFSSLTKTNAISSCEVCYTSFHLNCIAKWASRSIIESTERANLLAARNTNSGFNTTTGEKVLEGGTYSCPGCNFKRKEVPKIYYCFCKRVKDPQLRLPIMPHSCGQQCAKPRPDGCSHGCGLLCHPGPCNPCSVVLTIPCHCNKVQLPIRCSSLYTSLSTLSTASTITQQSELLSCKQPCGKLLSCELHLCTSPCHEGNCEPCSEIRGKKCFCGKEERKEECGNGGSEGRIICFKPGSDGEEIWEGEWSCENVCDAPYDCNHHNCTLPCHPHTSPTALPCPRSPSILTTCPCTSTPLSVLLPSPRTSCQDPIPLCSQRCPKILDCGHACRLPCHIGNCGPCSTEISIICRCGNLKSTRKCGERLKDGITHLPELKCEKICRAMRSCGRHECLEKCCPLAYQEAARSKSKGKRRVLDLNELENDPLGIHTCQRICGRKLNCGSGHLCELKDHKGACPPCLNANFSELICHCGSTILLPPIPCGTTIHCLHPCIRRNQCGHPITPHACHEEEQCPPCPFLVEKSCACGKKRIGNVRCSQDIKKVNCGLICGRLLNCGFHTCKKTCHVPNECETSCSQICLKPRRICGDPCSLNCHAPSPCSIELPCSMSIELSCSCGHIKQKVKCSVSESKPEGNREKLIKCTDACIVVKRNLALAEALGIEKKEPKVKEVEYDPIITSFYSNNITWCTAMETTLTEFVKSDSKPALHLPVMKHPQRQFTHELAELFDLRSESLDEEPRRSVMVHRQSNSGIPTPTLAESIASRKTSSNVLTFASLRKALPERSPSNAILLEGVQGYDEDMLRDILKPLMRGLAFSVKWVSSDDVLISFEPSTTELESKVTSIQQSLRTLIEETGFCKTLESVYVSIIDGTIKRSGWTPIGNSSRTPAARIGPIFTPNAFAALGDGNPKVVIKSTGVYKPPHLVKNENLIEDRYSAQAESLATAETSANTLGEERDLSNVPDSWDEEEEVEAEAEAGL